uniref:Pyrrolo-quinoline quinone repeat domain-containing protein n=1 Tax=Schlesneria paludicola TaxID=360056 RepID=A0A7C2P2J0_9PLAN
MSVLWVWPATLFAFTLWWLFASGFSWRVKLSPLIALVVLFVAFAAVFRIDGSDGDMVPTLSYRWSPTPEARAREYWKQLAVPNEPASEPVLEPLVAGPDDWPDYHGPNREGIVRGRGFRTDWEARPPQELWRHPVGLAWSSFSVLGDFAITQEQRDADECVVCYDLNTGEQLWVHADSARFTVVAVNGGDGPRATPVIAGDLTYTQGATGIVNCLETRTGKKRWSRNALDDAGENGQPAENLQWGLSAAPLVADGKVIVIAGGKAGRSVIAYDAATGEVAWTGGNFPASYGSPRVEEIHGVRQVLAFHGTGIAAFALDDGRPLWDFPWENMPKVNVAQPLKVADDAVVIGSGYGQGATRLTLTVGENGEWDPAQGWSSNRFKLKFNDAVLLDGFAYGLDDGILTCLDVATGKPKWKGGRFGYGQLIAFEDTLLVLGEEGDAVLVAAQPTKFEERGRIHVLDGTTWNHPAVAHGKLLVRNGSEAACYDVAP